MNQKVFVNRTLNLKKIKYIGLDMDHTLIRYQSVAFENLSFETIQKKMIARGYPKEILNLKFNYDLAIRGLVIDREKGHLLKLNKHSAIRYSMHGLKPIDFKTQKKVYKSTYIDLADTNYLPIDTTFSISLASMYMQLVELKTQNSEVALPDFAKMAADVLNALDEAHRDGSIKNVVRQNLDKYILKDPNVVAGLEKYKRHGKHIFVLTNSDYSYTKLLLDYAIDPFLKEHASWQDLFEVVITFAQKPRFFTDNLKFLKVDPKTGTMTNMEDPLVPGVYQGGDANSFTKDLGLDADEILYIGDHIYGDILRLKKDCGWRTAMVIEELDQELVSNIKSHPYSEEIEKLMAQKAPLEDELTSWLTDKVDGLKTASESEIEKLQHQISEIDTQISGLIKKQNSLYNDKWGQLMRVGNEESFFANQVERYACVYMSKLEDLLVQSPRSYFRAPRRALSHEAI